MRQAVIEQWVVNSAFLEPRKHYKFDDDGITDEIVPFDPLPTGTIAARVTNHYWDEVLKVYEVAPKSASTAVTHG